MPAKIKCFIKILLPAGEAKPDGHISATFGSKGAAQHVRTFLDKFNAETKGREGEILPVIVTIYEDKTISYVIKEEPVSKSILRVLRKEKGSGVPNRIKIGEMTQEQIINIAKKKIVDLNAHRL